MIGNNENVCWSEKNSHYWLSFGGLKNIIAMNPYDHLESEKNKNKEKERFFDLSQAMLMWTWWRAYNDSKKEQIYPKPCIQSNERNIYKKLAISECVEIIFK